MQAYGHVPYTLSPVWCPKPCCHARRLRSPQASWCAPKTLSPDRCPHALLARKELSADMHSGACSASENRNPVWWYLIELRAGASSHTAVRRSGSGRETRSHCQSAEHRQLASVDVWEKLTW